MFRVTSMFMIYQMNHGLSSLQNARHPPIMDKPNWYCWVSIPSCVHAIALFRLSDMTPLDSSIIMLFHCISAQYIPEVFSYTFFGCSNPDLLTGTYITTAWGYSFPSLDLLIQEMPFPKIPDCIRFFSALWDGLPHRNCRRSCPAQSRARPCHQGISCIEVLQGPIFQGI